MTYLLMNGKKLKPFALMEPLEDEVIDDLIADLPSPVPDDEGGEVGGDSPPLTSL